MDDKKGTRYSLICTRVIGYLDMITSADKKLRFRIVQSNFLFPIVILNEIYTVCCATYYASGKTWIAVLENARKLMD